ncbi:MAG: MetQ/NlpA family ABC transporter substrate-binding protein [Alistipes sp.]|nr:MetQ/NlpA family ABC transporter substrate-binding protein [Alistipes sp.]
MKKLVSLLLTFVCMLSLAACGDNNGSNAANAPTDGATTAAASDATTAAPVQLTKLVVGASVTPHAEILAVVKDDMAAAGYDLEIVEFSDYVIPNTSLEDGSLDANYFQHEPYLLDFNAENGTHLVAVEPIHYEPFGIYAGQSTSLADLPDKAKIAVPNDTTNEARALLLLEQEGLIKLKEGAGIQATKNDIAENPHNFEIVELQAEQVARALPDVNIGIINGNNALAAGLSISDALAQEASDSLAAQTYANVLVVKEGNETNPGIVALVEALKSDKVKKYIDETYNGAVVASFE